MEGKSSINHFLHSHPLTLVEEVVYPKSLCNGCKKSLSPGPIYGCSRSGCQFYLHQTCTELPREIQNFFHPCPLPLVLHTLSDFWCDACFERGSGFSYGCRSCNFDMHVECAQRGKITSTGYEDGDHSEEIIKHFTHWHPLRLVGKKDLQVGCGICENLICFDSFSAAAYGCEECNFYIHKSCMINIPQQINNHLFHPSCPLILLIKPRFTCDGCGDQHRYDLVFRCRECYFNLDVKCAFRPTLDANKILYAAHNHLLLALPDIIAKEVNCDACGEKFSLELDEDPCFGCKRCDLLLHKSCIMNIPQEINHLFHPSCPLTLLTPPSSYECADQSKDANKIQYVEHKHPLVALHDIIASKVDHPCGICEEKLSLEPDEDPCFGCERCDLFLHKSCMINIPQEVNHLFHPSCPLTLLTPPSFYKRDDNDLFLRRVGWDDLPSSYRCAGCDDEHASGLAYGCEKCGFQLDAKCALLPTLDQSKDADKIQHVAHKHPLLALPHNKKNNNIIDRCGVCGEKCPSNSCCGCERCQFYIHRRCAIEYSIEAEIHHYFHPLHPLTLSSPPTVESTTPSKCGACLGSIDEFMLVYRCAKCNFNLYVDCAKAKQQLLVKYEGHSHHLTFFDKTCTATSCHICDRAALNCFLRCVACDFNLHLYCHSSTPKTITPKCHLHPITLTESPFKFELISPEYQEASESDDEFYCDVCEEKRYKKESVYYCQECKFIAETRCVISKLLPSVVGSEGHDTEDGRVIISTDEENSALEASIAERDEEIANLKDDKEPLEEEIEWLQNTLMARKDELERMKSKLESLETDRFLWNYQLNLNFKQRK
ncbi:Zinc finger, PHD-type [Corchorus olitorius]|uniref:Zinc finger, PHD-type n=1 Tax=Corchorus olitorius TaxID=93759 RepID=A0A1R3G3C7_9ROSI|nr:Zinc finger, PHD-type [Corchorus olitorius]